MNDGTKDGWSCLLFSCLSSLYVSHHGHTLSLYVSHLFLAPAPPLVRVHCERTTLLLTHSPQIRNRSGRQTGGAADT